MTDSSDEREYQAIVQLERLIAQEPHTLDDRFVDEVMEALAETEEVPETYRRGARMLVSSLAAANFVLAMFLGLLIANNPGHAMKSLAAAVSVSNNAEIQMASLTPVIFETAASGAELPRPDDLVHVSVRASDGGNDKEVTLAHFLRVAAVEASPQGDAYRAKVTLLVPEAQTEQITLARLIGELRLSLSSPVRSSKRPGVDSLTIRDPEGRTIASGLPPYTQAVLYLPKGEDRTPLRRVLADGRWKEARETSLQVF